MTVTISHQERSTGPFGNHVLTMIEGQEQLKDLGRLVLWEGAQDILFEPL